MEEVETWWKQGKRDFLTAVHCYKSKDYYASVFFSQQAVEKSLKALYIKHHHKLWKIHDLVLLAKEVKASQKVVSRCAEITPAYFEVRYPESDELPADKVDVEKARKILVSTREVLRWVKARV